MSLPLLRSCVALLASAAALAAAAADDSSNYVSWGTGTNGGTGFTPWQFNTNNDNATIFGGGFLGSSTEGAGNVNVAGSAFGLYANPGAAFVDADRGFATPLTVNDVFSFRMALNFDNGNKGFSLFAGGQGQVFNFNVGGGAAVSSQNATLLSDVNIGYTYGGNDAVFAVTVSVTSLSSFEYEILRQSSTGTQGVLYAGTVTGLTEPLTGFRFYNSGTDAGGNPANNLYFNDLVVQQVPEPAAFAALAALGVLALTVARRRRAA